MCYNLDRYLMMQRNEIEEHRYYMAEKKGRPIEGNELLNDWIKFHAARFHNTL